MDAHVVGNKITELRKGRDMTQQELADAVVVTNKAVSKWETGRGLPDITMLPLLAAALGVSINEILSDSSGDSKLISQRKRRYYKQPVPLSIAAFIIGVASSLCFMLITGRINLAEEAFQEPQPAVVSEHPTAQPAGVSEYPAVPPQVVQADSTTDASIRAEPVHRTGDTTWQLSNSEQNFVIVTYSVASLAKGETTTIMTLAKDRNPGFARIRPFKN